jgi:hypothetical protein
MSSTTVKSALLADTVLLLILAVKTHGVFGRTGAAKAKAGRRAPEDSWQKKPPAEMQNAADAEYERWQRITNNDVENIPLVCTVSH